MTEDRVPSTEAGRRLGVDVEQELGVQFKSADMYRGWLATANALAAAIEAEARAEGRVEMFNEMGAKGVVLAEGRADALREAAERVRALPDFRDAGGGIWPWVSRDRVEDILDPEAVP